MLYFYFLRKNFLMKHILLLNMNFLHEISIELYLLGWYIIYWSIIDKTDVFIKRRLYLLCVLDLYDLG